MSTIILVRPGCTDFDEQSRVQGTLDLPLNQRGQRQVDRLIESLRSEPLDLILVGPAEPALGTANALGEALDVPVKVTEKLQNLDQGLWQGLEIDEVRRKYPKVVKQWQESPERICPPQGEPVSEAIARIESALAKSRKKDLSFVVVANEPLAGLIADLFPHPEENGSRPLCGCRSPKTIEYLQGTEQQVNGQPVAELKPVE